MNLCTQSSTKAVLKKKKKPNKIEGKKKNEDKNQNVKKLNENTE